MNIINRTTLRSMTKNRVRTIVTIIGIMLKPTQNIDAKRFLRALVFEVKKRIA